MHLGAGSLAALPLADGGTNDQNGAALTASAAMSISMLRAAVTVQITPLSARDMTLTVTGTWEARVISINIDASVQ